MFLLGISLCIMGYNLYLFMTEKQDIFKKFFNFDFIQPKKVINKEDKEKVSKLFSSEPEIPKSQVEKKTKAPVVVNDEIIVRSMMYLAFSYDHRIIDGKESVGFLLKIKELLENPSSLILSE